MADQTNGRSPRAQQIVETARALLEEEGVGALTMRRLADRLGIKAPSLYKHFPDKRAVEVALISLLFEELAEALEAAEAAEADSSGARDPLTELFAAYRTYALAHPHLYRLSTEGPLPREALPEGLEERAAMPLVRVCDGSEHLSRAVWAFAHGMVALEIHGRFPPGADLDKAWRTGLAAFSG
ncbi:TetR/AcrR family transcriptional regulator [Streptomyces sp. NPDC048172]|uniref:TetR/AcrR family transcriptional regulator n=1 Tax=Streptomyces sp. NPDC048172 TaxID=3365505 RepID=UPI0037141EA2